jgi:DNA polymerase-1
VLLDGQVSRNLPDRDLVAVCFAGQLAAVTGDGVALAGSPEQIIEEVARVEAVRHPRWVFWAVHEGANPLVLNDIHLDRCWDIAEAHRILAGGRDAGPALAWATVCRLPTSPLPRPAGDDLFDFAAEPDPGDRGDPESPVRSDGYLRPEADAGTWQSSGPRMLAWAGVAVEAAIRQMGALSEISPRAVSTGQSESAAALLCVELAVTGLPVHRPTIERLIEEAAGPRPDNESQARQTRRARDAEVLRQRPGHESTDLRNPLQVKDLLASVGVIVPDTRASRLEPFRHTHPLVEALLTWRKAERIATTYGWHWLDTNIGPDDRLRGGWTACDGAAGRMTAQNGLHNLPTPLRPAIAAEPGYAFVRSDLGQIEPRVLAAVSGDLSFARATQADDLYAPVGAALEVERPVAKIAVLAAMYGQTSGAAGEALKDLERAYPQAMDFLRRAYDCGVAGQAVRTYGGRRVPMWVDPVGSAHTAGSVDRSGSIDTVGSGDTGGAAGFVDITSPGDGFDGPAPARSSAVASRGRFARNAVIQGAAAELFKAWAATVRLTTRHLGARIVLCLHDELLIHVPSGAADETAAAVDAALTASARRWTGSSTVRFVCDTSVIGRWSDAKA